MKHAAVLAIVMGSLMTMSVTVPAYGSVNGSKTTKDVQDQLDRTFKVAKRNLPEIDEVSMNNGILIYGDSRDELWLVADYNPMYGAADNYIQLIQLSEKQNPVYSLFGITCGLVDSDVNHIIWYDTDFKEAYSKEEDKGWCTAYIDNESRMLFTFYSQYGYLEQMTLRYATDEEYSKYGTK